jgi:hypothetical protein
VNRPYRNNTLAALNDAVTAQADRDAAALPEPQETMAKDLAFRMAQEPGNRWRGYDACLREARELVRHAVSGGGAEG